MPWQGDPLEKEESAHITVLQEGDEVTSTVVKTRPQRSIFSLSSPLKLFIHLRSSSMSWGPDSGHVSAGIELM